IIFTTPFTPETFRYEDKVKRRRTIRNSQVSHHKVQQKPQLTVNTNPSIPTMRKMGNKDYWSTYKIPDQYEVETNLAGLSIRYKTQYQQAGNINFKISWINSCGNILSSISTTSASDVGTKFLMDICNKPNTRISGIFLFGFDIDCLHKARIKIPTNRKHSYTELKSSSQKNNESHWQQKT
ncbi:22215_t:CDS:2, partial [Racocetra persica]